MAEHGSDDRKIAAKTAKNMETLNDFVFESYF